jgi:hypothetical protein
MTNETPFGPQCCSCVFLQPNQAPDDTMNGTCHAQPPDVDGHYPAIQDFASCRGCTQYTTADTWNSSVELSQMRLDFERMQLDEALRQVLDQRSMRQSNIARAVFAMPPHPKG